MSQTLTISDKLYARLQDIARTRGLQNIEDLIQQLIEAWQSKSEDLRQRQETVRQIDALRERLFAAYGEMEDSVELIRADRAR